MKELITINKLAKLSDTTVRTLHYYDEVNLLSPTSIGENGYRQYSKEDIIKLQEIMTLKELGFSLKEIKSLIDSDSIARQNAFMLQKEILDKKRERLTKIINSIEKLLEENTMSFNQFDMREIEDAKNKYKDEAEQNGGILMPIKNQLKRPMATQRLTGRLLPKRQMSSMICSLLG